MKLGYLKSVCKPFHKDVFDIDCVVICKAKLFFFTLIMRKLSVSLAGKQKKPKFAATIINL